METWTKEEINDVMQKINQKVQVDRDFRTLVLSNPNAAVKQVSGKDIPSGFKIKAIESDPDYDATIALPPFIDDELSEKELEQVAGGECKGFVGACVGIDI